jgi:geranylgeranylglycerol-phosphate geranylgeranyltransferase
LITFASVWGGAIVASDLLFSWRIVVASLSAAFIVGYGNIVNDIFDVEIDRLIKTQRPLVKGTVRKFEAVTLAIPLGLTGMALSFLISEYAFVTAALAILLLSVYSPLLKGVYFLGNLVVAAVSALAFVYGGMAVDRPLGAWVLIVFSFLLHFGREVIKDIHDKDADIASGLKTGAAINDGRTSQLAAAFILILLAVAVLLPVVMGIYGPLYLIAILAVDAVLISSIWRLLASHEVRVMDNIAFHLKAIMPLGLVAVILGSRGL